MTVNKYEESLSIVINFDNFWNLKVSDMWKRKHVKVIRRTKRLCWYALHKSAWFNILVMDVWYIRYRQFDFTEEYILPSLVSLFLFIYIQCKTALTCTLNVYTPMKFSANDVLLTEVINISWKQICRQGFFPWMS